MADGFLEVENDNNVVKHVGEHVDIMEKDKEEEEHARLERDTVVEAVAGLYAMTVVGLGVVFPLAFFLSGERMHKGLYLSIFHVYVYSVALMFLIYLYISIQRYRKLRPQPNNGKKLSTTYKRMSELEENAAIAVIQEGERQRGSESENDGFPVAPVAEIESIHDEIAATEPIDLNHKDPERKQLTECVQHEMPLITYAGEGVNFFLRMGLIAFGLGSAMLDAFRLLQFLEAPDIWQCYGILFILHTSLRLIFILVQSFFLFKHHKIVLNYHKPLMKFGLLHLVATNIVTWGLTIVLEATGAFMHLTAKNELKNHGTDHRNSSGVLVHPFDGKRIYTGGCYRSRTLSDEAAPYLFPFVIEFSLLAAAILYRLYTNIGKCPISWSHENPAGLEEKEPPQAKSKGTQCNKANSGLFPGLVVFTLVFVGMCFTLYYDTETPNAATGVPPRGFIYLVSDLGVNIISLLALVPAFCYLRKLRFIGYLTSSLDQNLLLIALGGYYLLMGFMAVAAFSQFQEPVIGKSAPLLGILCVLTFVQCTLQVCFIFDGLRRRVKDANQAEQKPARSFITFLLICNLAMWIINTFELKEAHGAQVFTDFYGALSWTVIMHVCLPLAIYFRFHASVCLSDIWLHAYKREEVCYLTPSAAKNKLK